MRLFVGCKCRKINQNNRKRLKLLWKTVLGVSDPQITPGTLGFLITFRLYKGIIRGVNLFFKIFKNDLKKKTTNIIVLLVFIALASMLAAGAWTSCSQQYSMIISETGQIWMLASISYPKRNKQQWPIKYSSGPKTAQSLQIIKNARWSV